MATTQTHLLSQSAKYGIHVISFIVQDALCLTSIAVLNNSSAALSKLFDESALGIVFWLNVGVTTLSLTAVWLCQDEESYWVRPSSFRWLYARLLCAAVAIGLGAILYVGIAQSLSVSVLTITLGILAILTLIDACILSVRGLMA